tara:strand:+ start:615 stop:1013 length:399 start_codon:yes stop_codon:yes gene_type:complete
MLNMVYNCNAQRMQIIDMSSNKEMNYIFSRINPTNILKEELYNGGLYVNIYQMSDSKVTSKEFMEDFLSSFIISVSPDGDYYSNSRLYKIEGLYNPKILDIKESTSHKFLLKIEYGSYDDRKTEVLEFEGVE